MTNWPRPKTDPEDALLRSLMNQVVGQEGAALDGELDALGADPAAAPPEGADTRCRETIRRAVARRGRRRTMVRVRRRAVQVLVVAAVAASLLTAVYASSDGFFRARPHLTVVRDAANARWEFSGGKPALPADQRLDKVFDPDRAPEGYSLIQFHSLPGMLVILYGDGQGGQVEVDMSVILPEESYAMYVGSPDGGEQTYVNGAYALLVEDEERMSLAWADEARGLWVNIISQNMSREALMAYAEDLF